MLKDSAVQFGRFLAIILLFVWGCNSSSQDDNENQAPVQSPPDIGYAISSVFPHDTTSYTEGLLFNHGQLFESTGYSSVDAPLSRSCFGVVDLQTGKINIKAELDKNKYFGEGIAFLDDKVYQITWQEKVGFIFDAKSFRQIGQFNLPFAEGWGMTTNGKTLIISDGSDTIYFVHPGTFQVEKKLNVNFGGTTVSKLNELELIKGFLYANQYQTNYILKIDTATGLVVGRLNLFYLDFEAKRKNPSADVLNGIAYDSLHDRILVAGKLWPNTYEIKFNH